jgi:hypothetical protein
MTSQDEEKLLAQITDTFVRSWAQRAASSGWVLRPIRTK